MTNSALSQEIIDEFVGNAHGNLARVRELVEQYPHIVDAQASFQETALQAAAQMAREDIAKFLLAHGATLDIFGAAMLGAADRVREFLETDPALANAPGGHGFAPIFYAAVKSRLDIAELLFTNGADINMGEGNNTALHGAAMFGHTPFVEWLIRHGANVNALDYEGKTPLAVSLKLGHTATAEVLRKHGGNA